VDWIDSDTGRAPHRASVVAQVLAAHRSRRESGGSGRGGSGGSSRGGLLSDRELSEIEQAHPDGITAVQIVDVFTSRDVRFSEATFRKYVQQGLLPRSRRIGRKGKHRGSLGVYPAKTVRRINAIKRLMLDGYTIEEIQEQFLRYTDAIESLEEGFSEILARFDEEVESPRFDNREKRNLKREIAEAKKTADDLVRRIEGLSQRVSRSRSDSYRGTGAAGSAEDLL
jgi:DNA-binding transcriptional MerR regulator